MGILELGFYNADSTELHISIFPIYLALTLMQITEN